MAAGRAWRPWHSFRTGQDQDQYEHFYTIYDATIVQLSLTESRVQCHSVIVSQRSHAGGRWCGISWQMPAWIPRYNLWGP